MSTALRLSCLLLPAAILASVGGCSQFDLRKPIPWSLGSRDKPGRPDKVVTTWSDTVLYRPDRPASRGFGGRLMFYNGEDDKPIKVDGSLVVYAFDESAQDPEKVKPDRKYVFPAEHLTQHYSKSKIGHSYSFWIPWDEVGGPQKEISLIARFQPAQGGVVVSEPTRHLLPGKLVPAAEKMQLAQEAGQRTSGQGDVRAVSYETPVATEQEQASADRDPPQRMSTTTISIPSRFGSRMPVAATGPRGTLRGVTARREVGESAARGQPSPPQTFPQQASQAAPPLAAQQGPLPQQAGFSPARSQARGGPTARPTADRSPWPPRPAAWPFRPGSQHSAASGSGSAGSAPAAWPAPY